MLLLFTLMLITGNVLIFFANKLSLREVEQSKRAIEAYLTRVFSDYAVDGDKNNLVARLVAIKDALADGKGSGLNWLATDDALKEDADQCQSDVVCNEIYLGNLASLPWHQNAWVLEKNCTKPVQGLLTVLLMQNDHSEKVINQFHSQYPGLSIIMGVSQDYHHAPRSGVIVKRISESRST